MKTHYKYIHFEETPNPGKKTTKWNCMNTNDGDHLGYVYWKNGWRQYIFHPWLIPLEDGDTFMEYLIFNAGCLRDIADFLDQLKKNQRGKWKSKDGSK